MTRIRKRSRSLMQKRTVQRDTAVFGDDKDTSVFLMTDKINASLFKTDSIDVNDTNALVLPPKKVKTKKMKKDKKCDVTVLSRKKRKHLKHIVEQKRKKSERGELLLKLEGVQVADSVLTQLTSLSSVQTKGLKRQFAEDEWKDTMANEDIEVEETVVSQFCSKSTKLRRTVKKSKRNGSDDILGFSSSSSDESIDEDDDDNSVTVHQPKVDKSEVIESKTEVSPNVIENEEVPISKAQIIRKPLLVSRSSEIQSQREKLPILSEEYRIMEAVNDNDVVIIIGETGSGKTTQVPQFLYEAGYASDDKIICVTEPRRLAAEAMSRRVGLELGKPHVASYQIRFAGNCNDATRIKFVTDGILLREIKSDFRLSAYSAIIIDEAHERTTNTDVLIGLLSRIVLLRRRQSKAVDFSPLKLIIMSATLRVEDFIDNSRLFKVPPPLINIDSRQFDVECHFSKITPNEFEYVDAVYRKVCSIHRRLPIGGILVFLTGRQEVLALIRKLQATFSSDSSSFQNNPKITSKQQLTDTLPSINLCNYSMLPLDDTEIDNLYEDKIPQGYKSILVNRPEDTPMKILPLYAILSTTEQHRIFEPVTTGVRLCVVATNVAETSLTIPGIKYVVDSGRVKIKFYDQFTGVSKFCVTYTSKDAADQRAGRAGRVGPGHCYRIYSSAVYNDLFPRHAKPEILTRPVEDIVLCMKAMNIDKVLNFPFPTPPPQSQLENAEQSLVLLDVLKAPPRQALANKQILQSRITKLGQAVAKIPVSPRFGKMIIVSKSLGLLPHVLLMVASLSVNEILLESGKSSLKELISIYKAWSGTGQQLLLGDPMILISAVGAAAFNGVSPLFCNRYSLREKAVHEVLKLRRHLAEDLESSELEFISRPTEEQARQLRRILLIGMADKVARRIPSNDSYECTQLTEPVYLRSSSVLRSCKPEWIVYQEVYEAQLANRDAKKLFFRNVTAIEPEWLAVDFPHLCRFSKPLESPLPRYDSLSGKVMCHVIGTFGGRRAWSLPPVEIEYPSSPGHEKFKYFAKFLLEGKVIKKLENLTLLMPAATILKSWACLQSRTISILNRLIDEDVYSFRKLELKFVDEPKFLLNEILLWIPESHHVKVSSLWPLI